MTVSDMVLPGLNKLKDFVGGLMTLVHPKYVLLIEYEDQMGCYPAYGKLYEQLRKYGVYLDARISPDYVFYASCPSGTIEFYTGRKLGKYRAAVIVTNREDMYLPADHLAKRLEQAGFENIIIAETPDEALSKLVKLLGNTNN